MRRESTKDHRHAPFMVGRNAGDRLAQGADQHAHRVSFHGYGHRDP
jgi:hypothetical protein